MSTIEPSTQGMVVSKQIGKRILEIMEENGKGFTQQALATRIGMNKQTLSMKLRGHRDMYLFELRRIADALHLTVERVMQEDTRDDEKKLRGMFASLVEDESVSKIPPDFDEMLLLAKNLSAVAVGRTERCLTLNDLGRAYFYLNQYEDAHAEWIKSLQYAKQTMDKTNNQDIYHLVLSNLLLSYTVNPTHTTSNKLLDEMEHAFSSNPHRLGIVYYARAKKAEFEGNIKEAKSNAIFSLECFRQTGTVMAIGKAEATVAHYEFLLGNYSDSKHLLESSIRNLAPYKHNWLISIKDYAKTLLKLQQLKQIDTIVVNAISQAEVQSPQYRDLVGKLRVLLSISQNKTSHAESVLFDNRLHVDVRTLAYQYLKRHCIKNGDKDTLMKYVIIEDELGTIKRDLLEEELF